MKLYAVSTALLETLSLEQAIAAVAETGFKHVELGGDAISEWIADPPHVRRIVEAAGLTISSLHSPEAGWDNGNADPAARAASLQIAADSLFRAAEMGCSIVIIHPNKPPTEGQSPFTTEAFADHWSRSRESLSYLAEQARAAGVRMAVENMPARGQPRPGAAMKQIIDLICDLGAHVGTCLDAGHSNANGVSAASEAAEAGERLFAVHIQDNDGAGGDQHIMPGLGTTDWPALLAVLDEINFAGPRTFEVLRGDAPKALLRTMDELRRCWING